MLYSVLTRHLDMFGLGAGYTQFHGCTLERAHEIAEAFAFMGAESLIIPRGAEWPRNFYGELRYERILPCWRTGPPEVRAPGKDAPPDERE